MDEPPRNANAARARGGASEKIRQVGQQLDNKTDAQKQLLSELAAARRHLERRAYATVTMLDWKVELQRRIVCYCFLGAVWEGKVIALDHWPDFRARLSRRLYYCFLDVVWKGEVIALDHWSNVSARLSSHLRYCFLGDVWEGENIALGH